MNLAQRSYSEFKSITLIEQYELKDILVTNIPIKLKFPPVIMVNKSVQMMTVC